MKDHIPIRTYCHDCSCRLGFEGVFCEKALLDGFHATSHVCSREKWDPKHSMNMSFVADCNTEAVEQLWSKTNRLAPLFMKLNRRNFRFLLCSYARWRDGYVRSSYQKDINSSRSMKQYLRNCRQQGVLGSEVRPGVSVRKRPAAAMPQSSCDATPSEERSHCAKQRE